MILTTALNNIGSGVSYGSVTLSEATAQHIADKVWANQTRELTTSVGLDESQLHTALDNYTNKDEYKADVSNLSADVNVVQVAGSNVSSVDDFKATDVNLTPTIDAINNLNNFNPATDDVAKVTLVQTTVNNNDMAKMTENELHEALDSYANKFNWKADISNINAKNTENELHEWLDSYANKNNWKGNVNILNIAEAVWNYVTRDLTVVSDGFTQADRDRLNDVPTADENAQTLIDKEL